MLTLSYSALADTAIVSTQTVDFSGSAVMAIDANSESIQASHIDGTMFRFWPGTSNKIAACITKPSLFRFRSGYKYRVRFRVAVADIGSKFTRLGVAFGIAGGDGQGIIFRKGKVIKTVPEAELVDTLFREIDQYLENLDEESLC